MELIWLPVLLWYIRHRPRVTILQDGVRILSNYPVHFLSRLLGKRIYYYSHGYNHQASLRRHSGVVQVVERIRRWLLNQSSGVIVYSEGGARHLRACGVEANLFVVNNTIDTDAAITSMAEVDPAEVTALRRSYNIGTETRVVMTLGRLIPAKNLDLFISVIRALNQVDGPPCVGIIVGDGPLRDELESKARDSPIIFAGYRAGRELSVHLGLADTIFMPGMVGLAIVESFCAGKPFVALNLPSHSPEIEYLNSGENGLMIESKEPTQIAEELKKLLDSPALLATMSSAARQTSETVCSAQNMIEKFRAAFVDSCS